MGTLVKPTNNLSYTDEYGDRIELNKCPDAFLLDVYISGKLEANVSFERDELIEFCEAVIEEVKRG